MARVAGQMYGWVGASDVIDASVAVLVSSTYQLDRETVLLMSDTMDMRALDMRALLAQLRTSARIVEV